MLLPITLLWPIIFLGGTTNALRWAHCISGYCYRLLCFGQLYFWKVLPMYSDGPMALADAAANCFAWAHQNRSSGGKGKMRNVGTSTDFTRGGGGVIKR